MHFTFLLLIVTVLFISACGSDTGKSSSGTSGASVGDVVVDDIKEGDIGSSEVRDGEQANVDSKYVADYVEEVEEAPQVHNRGVFETVEKARSLDRWSYRHDGALVTLYGSKIKVLGERIRELNTFYLDTDTKLALGYVCDEDGKKCHGKKEVDYSLVYQKTPLDWLNEEDFVDAVMGSSGALVKGRSAVEVSLTEDRVKKTYWFDVHSGVLLKIEFFDEVKGERVLLESFEFVGLPAHVNEWDVTPP